MTEMSAIPGHYWITDRAPFNQFMPTKDYKDLRVLYIGWTIFHRLNIMISVMTHSISINYIYVDMFLAVQDSSISDIVCPLVGRSEPTNNQSLGSIKEWP